MAVPGTIRVRRGTNVDLYFDSYTDTTETTRIDPTGWRFTLSYAVNGAADVTWSTDDDSPALTIIDATDPTGKRFAFHLDTTDVDAVFVAGGALTLLRIDPADPANVQPLMDPVPVNVGSAP